MLRSGLESSPPNSSIVIRPMATQIIVAAIVRTIRRRNAVASTSQTSISPCLRQAANRMHLGRINKRIMIEVASLPTGTPMSVAYCRSDEARDLVQRLVGEDHYDLIHTEFVRAAPITADVKGLPSVFDAVDSLALAYRRSLSAPGVPPARRLIALVEWFKMRRYEPRVVQRYDRVLVSSPVDRDALVCARQNDVEVARQFGLERPRVAILAASETVHPKVPSSIDALALSRMAAQGWVDDAVVASLAVMDRTVSPFLKGRRAEWVAAPEASRGQAVSLLRIHS